MFQIQPKCNREVEILSKAGNMPILSVSYLFEEMSQSEINEMSDEEFKAISPFEKKSCYDCGHLKSALSSWCTSVEARKARGTTISGCVKCVFWKPDWKVIDDKYKTEENGYKSPTNNENQLTLNFSEKWLTLK